MSSNLLSTEMTTQAMSQLQNTQEENILLHNSQHEHTHVEHYNDNLTLEQIRDRNKFELMILLTQIKKKHEQYTEELAISMERANLQKAKFDLSKKAEVEEILSLDAEQIQNLFVQRLECIKAEINTKSEQKYHLNQRRNVHQVLDQQIVAQVNSLRRQIGQLSDQLKETINKEKQLDDEKEEAQKQVALLKDRQKSHALKVFGQVKQKMAKSMSKYIMQSEGQTQKMAAPPGLPNPSSITSRFQAHYFEDTEEKPKTSPLGQNSPERFPSPITIKNYKANTDIVRKSPLRYTRFLSFTPSKTPGLPRLSIMNFKAPSRLGNMSRLTMQHSNIMEQTIQEGSVLKESKKDEEPKRAITSSIDTRNKEYLELHKDCNKQIRKLKEEFNELVEQNNKFQRLIVEMRNKIQKILLKMNLKTQKQGFLEILQLSDKQVDRFMDEFMEDGCIEVLLDLCLLEDASYNIKPKKGTNQRVGLDSYSNGLQRRYDIIYDV